MFTFSSAVSVSLMNNEKSIKRDIHGEPKENVNCIKASDSQKGTRAIPIIIQQSTFEVYRKFMLRYFYRRQVQNDFSHTPVKHQQSLTYQTLLIFHKTHQHVIKISPLIPIHQSRMRQPQHVFNVDGGCQCRSGDMREVCHVVGLLGVRERAVRTLLAFYFYCFH